MDLQEVLTRVAELSHEELHIVANGLRRGRLPAITGMTLMRCAMPLTGSTTMRTSCAAYMTTNSASTGATRAEATAHRDHLECAYGLVRAVRLSRMISFDRART
jgi:hypothetical protein